MRDMYPIYLPPKFPGDIALPPKTRRLARVSCRTKKDFAFF